MSYLEIKLNEAEKMLERLKRPLNISIDDIGLSEQVKSVLHCAVINTVGDIVCIPTSELLKVPLLEQGDVETIYSKLAQLNFVLKHR